MSVADSLRRTRRRLALFARSTIVAVVVLSPVARIASAEVAAIASSPNVFAVPDPNAALTFDGSAFGHGVGLCQWGSRGRAAAAEAQLPASTRDRSIELFDTQPSPTGAGFCGHTECDKIGRAHV